MFVWLILQILRSSPRVCLAWARGSGVVGLSCCDGFERRALTLTSSGHGPVAELGNVASAFLLIWEVTQRTLSNMLQAPAA